jgi:LacI family transcriptional regulator
MPPAAPPRSLKVALVFPLRPGPWPEIVRGVYRYAARADPPWLLSLFTHEDAGVALAGEPDGIVAMVRTPEAAAKLAAWRGPVVDTAANLESHPFARVLLDGVRIGRVAAEYLAQAKGRRFAFVGDRSTLAGREALEGFSDRLRELGLACEVAPAGQFDDPYSEEPTARTTAAVWLARLRRPVAIFACHDALAHRLVEVCSSAGLRVPDDVAVLGLLNDEFLCLTSRPPLSSLAVPLAGLGYEAARALDLMMAGGGPPDAPVLLPPGEVVVRQSTDSGAVADPEVVAALLYIRDHSRQAIGVGDIAEASGVSRSSLERRFRAALGRGPLAELIRVRVEHAKRLLAESSRPVKEVARAAGFHDTRHLSITFRAKTGMTPLEYRACFRPGVG